MQPISILNGPYIPNHLYQYVTPASTIIEDEPTIWHETPNHDCTSSAKTAELANRHQVAWHFLTLGIPLLFQTLSVFWGGIIHREKIGLPMRVRFKHEHLTLEKVSRLHQFQKFNEVSTKPLKASEQDKALHLVNLTINACQKANLDGDAQGILACKKKLEALANLLEKNHNPKMTRADFDEEDWRMLDLIDYELINEFCGSLADLFNAEWFKNSITHQHMLRDFGFDYYEAVIAEILSLSLAYIEGMDGKPISLPLFDPSTKAFRSVEYIVKATRLGDDMPCYILESQDPKACNWFAVRGTQRFTKVTSDGREHRLGSFESMLADALDHKCLARNVINKALVRRPIVKENGHYVQKESLEDIFRRWRQEGKMANLCGHSLGGTIVNTLTVEFYDQIATAYAFSAAGVSKETSDKWDELNKDQPDTPISGPAKLINIDHEGDIVPSSGRCLIGRHVAIEALAPLGSNGFYSCHVRKHLCRDFQIQKVDVNKENNKLERAFCERVRIIVGNILNFFLTLFSGAYLPDWWRNRKVYREHAALHRRLRPYLVAA